MEIVISQSDGSDGAEILASLCGNGREPQPVFHGLRNQLVPGGGEVTDSAGSMAQELPVQGQCMHEFGAFYVSRSLGSWCTGAV